ncbi:hypothetical protein PF002_g25140 [Phytophthora fragariae]|uniref:Uncharacterized protein n=1 Tax=Phytophthora fragariae TaxID=53985 RepID=A0A6A3WQQ2_9STRA|nr:hypothetical protein PF002_g25140 [Phytophthora fragariae]
MPVRASLLPSSTACVLGSVLLLGGRARKAAAAPRPVLERMGLCHPLCRTGRRLPINQTFFQVDLGSGRDTR